MNHGFQLIYLSLKLGWRPHWAGGFEPIKGLFDLRKLHDDVAIVQNVDRIRIHEEIGKFLEDLDQVFINFSLWIIFLFNIVSILLLLTLLNINILSHVEIDLILILLPGHLLKLVMIELFLLRMILLINQRLHDLHERVCVLVLHIVQFQQYIDIGIQLLLQILSLIYRLIIIHSIVRLIDVL